PPVFLRPLLLRNSDIISPPPSHGDKSGVLPLGLNPAPVPVAAVIEHEDQPLLLAPAGSLHDVDIVIKVKNGGGTARVILMCSHERGNPAFLTFLSEPPGVIVLPKHAGVAFVREDESVRQH